MTTKAEYKLYQYHSTELKFRIFYIFLTLIFCFISLFYNMEFILYKIAPIQPSIEFSMESIDFNNKDVTSKITSTDFIFTDIFEAFLSYIVLSGYFTFLFSLPFIYYHLYKFLLPGLSYTESTLMRILFYSSLFLIIFAHLLTYTVILPYAISFFLTFQTGTPFTQTINPFNDLHNLFTSNETFIENNNAFKISPNITFLSRIYSWILFLIHLFTAVSFLFQLPLVLFILFLLFLKPTQSIINTSTQTPLNTAFQLKNTTFLRKILFFLLVLLTAIFSPPDLYSQFFLFVPLFFVIEIFIFALFFYFEYIKTQLEKTSSKNKTS